MTAFPDLPELLAEIAGVAGLSAALAIAQHRGGMKTHFPAKADDDHWLPVLIGREATDKLCKHFTVNHRGGVSLVVPLGPSRVYDVIRMRAMALREEGLSISQTARAVNVTTRAIEQWWAERNRTRGQSAKTAVSVEHRECEDGRPIVALADLLVLVAEIAGMPVALALAQARATRIVDFPVSAPDEHWLVQSFGRETADKLAAYFGQAHGREVAFVVPRATPFLHAFVQRRALVMREAGRSAEDVARALCVTPAQVEKWCAVERAKAAKRAAEAAVAALQQNGEG